MAKGDDFVRAVDAFMAAPKRLHGAQAPTWQAGRDSYAARLKLPIEIGGELSGQHLAIDAYPSHDPHVFMIGLLFSDRIVCRLDYDPTATHDNKWKPGLDPQVTGPHWHSWEINRDEFRKLGSQLPRLPYAIQFSQARAFDACLRWYCGERQIILGSHNIDFPHSGVLL